MQRVKGHGNQGGVRNGTENSEHENVNNWAAHQNYNAAPNGSLTVASYSMSNYYGASYPYPAYCVGDGATTWPNNEGITYMSEYNGQMAPAEAAYGVEGMFGAATFGAHFGQTAAPNAASFNYFPGTAEYQAWETSASLPPMADKQYQEYYRENLYDSSKTMKGLDQRLHNLDINADTNSNKMLDASKYCYGVVKPDPYTNSLPQTVEKKTTWASVAKQPAKPMPQTSSTGTKKKGPGMPPPPIVPGRHNIDLNTWEVKNNNVAKTPVAQAPPPPPSVNSLAKPIWNGPIISPDPPSEPIIHMTPNTSAPPPLLPCTAAPPPPLAQKIYTNSVITNRPPPQAPPTSVYQAPPPLQPVVKAPVSTSPPQRQTSLSPVPPSSTTSSTSPSSSIVSPYSVVDKLKEKNIYNPSELNLPPKGTRFFVIKSYSEDDVHRSIKYEIWCSTEHGNKRLDDAFNDQKAVNGAVYLFFSVNGSGHFCGVARMISAVDYGASSSVWAQDKWKGQFRVRWIYVKDVPNGQLRHIRLENNENKPVTNSRDTQEVPYDKGVSVLKIIHSYSHTTSIFDDFTHYEKRQEEGDCIKRAPPPPMHQPPHRNNAFGSRSSQIKDRDGGGMGGSNSGSSSSSNNYNSNHNRRGGREGGGGRDSGRDSGWESRDRDRDRERERDRDCGGRDDRGSRNNNGNNFTNHRNQWNSLRS